MLEDEREFVHTVTLRVLSPDPRPTDVVRRVIQAIGRGCYSDLLDTAEARCEETGESADIADPTAVEREAFDGLMAWRREQIKEVELALGLLHVVPEELWIPEETGGLTDRDGEHEAGESSKGLPDRAAVDISDEAIEETIRRIRDLVDAPEAPAPSKFYAALVVRDLIVKTPCSAMIGGIPARSPEEARARAEEAARRLPEPPIEIDDDAEKGWSIGDPFDPELGPLEIVEVFEEAAADREE